MKHRSKIESKKLPRVGTCHRLVCSCGTTSPWTAREQTAQLARDAHDYENAWPWSA